MNRITLSIGHIRTPDIKLDEDGHLDQAAILRMFFAVVSMAGVINGGIQLGNGDPNSEAGNFDAIFLRIPFTTANTEVTMPHDLGRPPAIAIPVFKDRACDVYSLRGAANAWGDNDKAYFTCSVANAKVTMLLA